MRVVGQVMDCIIYVRWSSIEQGRGSSRERQLDVCRRHAEAKGWNVVEELIDEGISAFSGKNVAVGELSRFTNAVEAGEHPAGIILLTEKVDRISREKPKVVFSWMLRVTEKGVVVAIADGDKVYNSENLDMAAIITLVVESSLANAESEKKADRLAGSWKAKRRKAASGEELVMTLRAPGWLKVEGTPRRFVLIEERAAIVRRIFKETVDGLGKNTIARRLNLEGVETFGRASGWHGSYIQKILNNSSVLGEMQPGRKARGAPRTLEGDPIQNYYPVVVDADLYAQAKQSQANRTRRVAGRGRRLVNIFAGLARCGECNEKMTFRGKGEKKRADGTIVNEDYLVCDSYQRGRGCANGHHFNYPSWETAILNAILAKAMGDAHFSSSRDVRMIEIEIADMVRRRDEAIRKRDVAMTLFEETGRDFARESSVKWDREVESCDRDLPLLREKAVRARGTVSPAEHQRRIGEMFEQMESGEEEARFVARSRVMDAVHELTASMVCKRMPAIIEVTTKGGLGIGIEHTSGSGPDAQFWYRYDEGFFG